MWDDTAMLYFVLQSYFKSPSKKKATDFQENQVSGFLNGSKLWLSCETLTASNDFNSMHEMEGDGNNKFSKFSQCEGVIIKCYWGENFEKIEFTLIFSLKLQIWQKCLKIEQNQSNIFHKNPTLLDFAN